MESWNMEGSIVRLYFFSPVLTKHIPFSCSQMVKNLVFLAKTLQILSSEGSPIAENNRDRHASNENLTSKEGPLTLKDLLRKLNKEATLEDSLATRQTQKVRFFKLVVLLLMYHRHDCREDFVRSLIDLVSRYVEIGRAHV